MSDDAVTTTEILRPAEAAERLGVRTRVVIKAMYYRKVPRVELDDGTLGIPADSLHLIDIPTDPSLLRDA